MDKIVLGIMVLGVLAMLVGSVALGSGIFDSVLGLDFGDLDGWKIMYTFGFLVVVMVIMAMVGVANNL